MKVAFLQKDSFVKIAVEQLSAVLVQSGHESEVFIESGEKNFLSAILKSDADLYAFSCTTGGEYWVNDIAAKIKSKSSKPIIVGGPHATFFPELIENPNIDYICRGEGEFALVDLVEALQNNPQSIRHIENIWSKDESGNIHKTDVRPFIEDMDVLPAPDFEVYSKYKYLVPYNSEMYSIMTGRGCPFNCNYCFNKSYKEIYHGKGRYLRRRSPEHVIKEILDAKAKYGVKKLNFVDDSFFSFPSWLKEFSDLYREKVNLPFIINIEATQVKDEYARIASEMGCICARMGVETGNENLRKKVLNKNVSNQQIIDAARSIKRHGIKLSTYNILGLPGETMENAMETYQLNKDIGADFTQCSLLQPYPGTSMYDYVADNGFLDDSNSTALEESFFVSSKIKVENKNGISNLQKLMQFFIETHMPGWMIRSMLRIPDNLLYSIIFKSSFIFNKMRFQKIGLLPTILLGMHSLSYMKGKARA